MLKLNDFMAMGALVCATFAAQPAGASDTLTPVPVDADWWRARHAALVKEAQARETNVLFLGDSITFFWCDQGASDWWEYLRPLQSSNFGIGGDRIENVLWRIENGELEGLNPRVVVLLIGTNNLSDTSVDDVAAGHVNLVAELERRLPDAKILLLGIFPRVDDWSAAFRAEIGPVNERLKALASYDPRLTYLDFGSRFLDTRGGIAKDVSYDGLHFTKQGYRIWIDAMMPTLDFLLGRRSVLPSVPSRPDTHSRSGD